MRNMEAGLFARSWAEVKKVRTLAVVGMFLALKIVLDFATIQLSASLHLSFEYLAAAVVGMLYGPAAAALYGAAGDILCCWVNPKGPYFIGFTLIAVVGGIVNGCLLYGKKPTLGRVALDRLVNTLLCNVILNTVCIAVLYSRALMVMLPARLVKNAVLFPVETILLYLLLKKIDARKKELLR